MYHGAAEQPMSVATSFTSSFSTQSHARSKRNRASQPPIKYSVRRSRVRLRVRLDLDFPQTSSTHPGVEVDLVLLAVVAAGKL